MTVYRHIWRPRRLVTRVLPLALLLTLIAAMACAPAFAAERTATGSVVRLVSADTVEVRDHLVSSRVVRLAGILVPEAGEPRGIQVFLRLRQMLRPGTPVTIVPTGRHGGQALAVLRIAGDHCQGRSCPHTLDVGLALLTVGLARYQPTLAGGLSREARGQYEFAEVEARARRSGLWAGYSGAGRRGRRE
jgi:endonuclease YncB( thermonuclease family)